MLKSGHKIEKLYYSIGEVAGMVKVNTSLIRYWENEFDIIEPRKNRKGDRFFKPTDVKNLQMIHDLLRRRKFTIEGAKDYIKKNKQAKEKYGEKVLAGTGQRWHDFPLRCWFLSDWLPVTKVELDQICLEAQGQAAQAAIHLFEL